MSALDPSPQVAPNGEPADAGTDMDERERQLVDCYWEERRRGDTPRPHDWLDAHACSSPEVLDQIEVMDLAQRSKERRKGAGGQPASGMSPRLSSKQSDIVQPSLQPATQLAGGEIWVLGWLGAGGMGELYRAWHTMMNCELVVKLAQGPATRARFRREIEIQARLGGHLNIALARTAGQHEGRDYLVMDYVPGFNLQHWVKARGPMPWAEACRVVRDVAEGLKHAHTHQIVHRDIKPSNLVRLARGGSIKIIDWGLARRFDTDPSEGDADLTDSRCRLGTWGYMSPEQIKSPSTVGPASDLYSLGCTFYYLLTGQSLFGESLDRPRRAPALPEGVDVPPEVERVYRRLLSYEPARRYQSAKEVVEGIDAILGSGAEPKEPTRVSARWKRWQKVGVAAVAVATLGLGMGWVLTNSSIWSTRWFGPNPPLAAYSAPRLETLVFAFYRKGRKQPEEYQFVDGDRRTAAASTAPLGPDDTFVIEGRFQKPTYWYIIWLDTKGVADVMEASPNQRNDLRFPLDPDTGAYPDSKDPIGTHLVLLTAGAMPPSQAKARLKELVAGSLKPPVLSPGQPWHYTLDGTHVSRDESAAKTRGGKTKPLGAEDRLSTRYLEDIQQRLRGDPVQPLHAFFVSTKR